MEIRHAAEADYPRILEIYQYARAFMASHGNPDQWGDRWPPSELVRKDIENGDSYVCLHEGEVVGVFYFKRGDDPSYAVIEDGAWRDDSPYGVVHRLAGNGACKGIGAACINWAYQQCGHLRIDTHEDNAVMQNLLAKLGFFRCGIIHIPQDDAPRIAYEKCSPPSVGP